MLNQLHNELQLKRPLKDVDVIKLTKIFDVYEKNIILQGNAPLIEWVNFQKILKQQEFGLKIGGFSFYSRHSLKRRLARTMKLLKLNKVTQSKLSAEGSIAQVPKSRLLERDTAAFNDMMNTLSDNINTK